MFKKLKNILKNNKGEAYIGYIIGILISLLFLVLSLRVLPVFIAKYQMTKFASEIVREAEISGEIGTKVNKKIESLEETLIAVDTINWDAKFIDGTKKINLNDEIKVTLTKEVSIDFYIFKSPPITLRAVDTGSSEVYHK